MIVNQLTVLHRHVTGIRYNHRIGNCVIDIHTAGRISALCDTDLRCCSFRGYCRCCRNFLRIISANRRCVCLDSIHDLAIIDILLSHGVGVGECCGLTGSQFEGLSAQVNMVIFQFAILHSHVADILHYHRIGDRVIDLHVTRRVSTLCDADLRSCFFCGYCRIRFNFLRIISANRRCVCLDSIHDLAIIDILLSHGVGVGEACGFTGSQFKCLVAQVSMVIFQFAGLHAYVANILHYYRIGYRSTDCHTTCRGSALGDAQFCLRLFRGYSRRRFNFLRIISAYCCCVRLYNVHNLAIVDILLGHGVGVGDFFCFLTGSQCECLTAQVSMVINQFAVLHAYIADVLHYHSVGDRITDLSTACRISALGNAQFRLRFFCGYCCCCRNFLRIISAYCRCVRLYDVHDLARVDILLCHGVGVSEGCFLIGSQGKCLVTQVSMVINQLAVLHAYIADVLHYYRVGYRITNSYAVCRICTLCDA